MKGREVVDRYVARANAGDLESLLNLFAGDAVVEHPSGRFEGVARIRGFYRDVVLPPDPVIAVIELEERPDGCRAVFESTSQAGPGRVRVVGRFLLDPEGRIAHLHVTEG